MKGNGSAGDLFFKQKTAYEMLRSLVGSEMCIRDRCWNAGPAMARMMGTHPPANGDRAENLAMAEAAEAVSYTHLTLPTIYSV